MTSKFTTDWLHAWNTHNLDAILEHYSDTIRFSSPIIQQMGVDSKGEITNKADLKAYFSKALDNYPDLHFELYHEMKGVNSLVLFYKSVNHSLSAEYMELNSHGKISLVSAHYKSFPNLTTFLDTWLKSWTSKGSPEQVETLLSFYSESCFYADPAIRNGIRGKINLREYFRKLLRYNPEWEWRRLEVFLTPGGCSLKWVVRIPVGREIIETTGLDILEFEDGKISRNEVFFDRHDWLQLISKTQTKE